MQDLLQILSIVRIVAMYVQGQKAHECTIAKNGIQWFVYSKVRLEIYTWIYFNDYLVPDAVQMSLIACIVYYIHSCTILRYCSWPDKNEFGFQACWDVAGSSQSPKTPGALIFAKYAKDAVAQQVSRGRTGC